MEARGVRLLLVSVAAIALHAGTAAGAQWIEAFQGDALWDKAVTSGMQQNIDHQDQTKSAYYVGRAWSSGSIVPCKVEFLTTADVAWCIDGDGNELTAAVYEVLTADATEITWQPAANGNVPSAAEPTGITATGEPIYSCRVMDTTKFGLLSGTLLPSSKECKINYYGVQSYSLYEVLVILRK